MGLYLHVYIGPYAECRYRNESREIDVYGCTNTACGEYKKRQTWPMTGTKFCAACGSAIGQSRRVDRYRPSPFDVLGESEALFVLGPTDNEPGPMADRLWFGANVRGPRNFNPDRNHHREDLTQLDREAEMQWFTGRFESDLAKLREAYDALTIKWGLHVYYM